MMRVTNGLGLLMSSVSSGVLAMLLTVAASAEVVMLRLKKRTTWYEQQGAVDEIIHQASILKQFLSHEE